MSKLTIVAFIHVKAGHVETVKAELEKLIPIARAEEGCLQYDLHQDNEDPAQFLFYENWESRELWQTHMNNQHLKDYLAATDGMVEKSTLNEMKHIA
ncbi:MAG: putative quinol monooxygenase [Planctomycetota bacterium]